MTAKEQLKVAMYGGDSMLGKSLATYLSERNIPLHILPYFATSTDCSRYISQLRDFRPNVFLNCNIKTKGLGYHAKFPAKALQEVVDSEMRLFPEMIQIGCTRLINVLPNCIYPETIAIPFKETELWNGKLEETVSYYGLAKKMLCTQALAYKREFSVKVANLILTAHYGPNDDFFVEDLQVLPALVKRFHEATENSLDEVVLWGSGNATREFIYIDDACAAIFQAMTSDIDTIDLLNIATGQEIKLRELADIIASAVGFKGKINWDHTKNEGILRKCLSADKMRQLLKVELKVGIKDGVDKVLDAYKIQRESRQKN